MIVGAGHLVGREEELAAVRDLLDHPGEPYSVAVLVGEAGIGKTTLWRAAVEAAEARGDRVLSCRAAQVEAGYSFAGLADLIGMVFDDVAPQLPAPQRRGLQAALALADGKVPTEERVVAFGFVSVLRALAQGGRLLLAIDDVQWLDASSLAMLRFAVPRIQSEPITALMCARDRVPAWALRTPASERLLTIEVGPLSTGALRSLMQVRLGAVPPRPTLLRIWQASRGNPFLALEIANAVQRGGGMLAAGEEVPVPATLDELVGERLSRLGAHGLQVARIVAALANPVLGTVEAAAGRAAQSGLSDALEARVLELEGDRLCFTHPLLRSAAYARWTPSGRRSLHARLAELVAGVEERARHLALATPEPNGEVAAVLTRAADSASRRGAGGAAAELAELAVRLTPAEDGEQARRRVLDAADKHAQAGDGRRAMLLLEQALVGVPAGTARAGLLARLARARADFVGSPSGAVGLYRQALAEAGADDALQAEIHLNLADLVMREHHNHALAHAESAVRAAARVGETRLRCRALAVFSLIHFRLGLGVPRAELDAALALERSWWGWPSDAPATEVLAFQLVWSSELERGRRVLEQWHDALRARDDCHQHDALWYLSILEWRAGNWPLAARHAADSLEVRAQFGIEGERSVAEFPAALIAAHRGEVDDARARSERALEADAARGVEMGHHYVLGFLDFSRGDAAAALPHLLRAWEIRDSIGILEPGHRLELGDTLEALIAVGELDEAQRRLDPWQECSRRLDRAWAMAITARCRALLLAARGDLPAAEASFTQALADHARAGDPFQRARTLLALGVTQRRAKQRGSARATLEQALAVFEKLAAPLWAERTRAELARIGGRPSSGRTLTATERRLAELVAEGYSNKQIAATLFLTPKSVATMLSRLYAKRGVRSRTELAHLLSEQPAGKL